MSFGQQTIENSIVGVIPTTEPVGIVLALRFMYHNIDDIEYYELDSTGEHILTNEYEQLLSANPWETAYDKKQENT